MRTIPRDLWVRAGRWLGRATLAGTIALLAVGGAWASDWVTEQISSNSVGYDVDIAVDNPNQVHLWYDRQSSTGECYAVRNVAGWAFTDLGKFGACDLALDPAGQPRLFYTVYLPYSYSYNVSYQQYKAEGEDPGWWSYPNLATDVSAGNATLAIDSAGNARVGYIDKTEWDLKCGAITGDLWETPTWSAQTVASGSVFSTHSPLIEMTLDQNDKPCFLWKQGSELAVSLYYARPSITGGWNISTLRTGAMSASSGMGVAFDSNNTLHVAFGEDVAGQTQIWHGTYVGTTWQEELVDSAGDRIGSLAIDSEDQLHLGYIDVGVGAGANDTIKYAVLPIGQPWQLENVASLSSASTGNERLAMDLDSAGLPHMAYRGDADELYYARPGAPPEPGPGDANGDGKVDAQDAAALAAHWLLREGATWRDGDFNKDGQVNDLDASILAAHWAYGATATTVPEPSALVCLLGLVAAAARGLRRRAV